MDVLFSEEARPTAAAWERRTDGHRAPDTAEENSRGAPHRRELLVTPAAPQSANPCGVLPSLEPISGAHHHRRDVYVICGLIIGNLMEACGS